MADKIIENNQVSMMGKIAAGFTISHQVFGEGFYMTELLVKRLSDSEDRIPVMVSERLVDVTQDYIGEYVEIHGQFRSYNRHEEKHNRLVLSVFSRELKFVEEEDETVPVNQIFLDGYICKPPVYRKTPLGREIADVLLAVNRPYGKSDYIPCICWGRNARFASGLKESSVDWHQSPIWIIAASPFASIFSDVSQSTSSGLSGPYSTARSRNL